MPDERFRGNPYAELDLGHDATNAQIKRRWRELAREHHPDRAAGDREQTARLTARMARINAAYDLLRDPVRRATYDSSPAGRRARGGAARVEFDDADGGASRGGPPPPPRTPPVTARFDTTTAFRPRNTRLAGHGAARPLRGQEPRPRRGAEERDLRASTPTGPAVTRRGRRAVRMPTLDEARQTVLNFGKYHGATLGEVELLDPAYIDWIARTITRDRDMVIRARLIEEEMDRAGVARPSREAAAAGSETRTAAG
jgi:curved DNA-binding protein CbpA